MNRWDFAWQRIYDYAAPSPFDANTRSRVTCDADGKVVVSFDHIGKGLEVRGQRLTVVNLWNKDGLPAVPFRTDPR